MSLMKTRRCRIWWGAALLFAIGLMLPALAVKAAGTLLLVRTPVEPADLMVVLGGDGPARASRAVEAYRAGLAPQVLVTGTGDCLSIRDAMVEGGVDAGAIDVECSSANTWENARFSAPLVAAAGPRRAILVTSWFHTRRALAIFRQVMPDVDWMSVPVEPEGTVWEMMDSPYGAAIIGEYIKIPWYLVRYGVDSF